MEYDDLIKFEKTYEHIDKKCENIFDSIEALDKNYTPLKYRESFDYDNFIVESGFITIRGSYCYQNDSVPISYAISFKSFLNSDLFLARLEAELMEKQRVRLEKHRLDKETKELELLAKLKEKYEK